MAKALHILASNIKRLRGATTQRDLAKKAGINVEVIRGIEQKRTWPEHGNVARIARALGVEESDLFNPANPAAPAPVDWRAISPRDAMLRLKAHWERLEKRGDEISDAEFEELLLAHLVSKKRLKSP